MKKTIFVVILLFAALIAAGALAHREVQAAAWQDKVDPWVLQSVSAGQAEFIVFLVEQADLGSAKELPTRLEKGTFVFEALRATAQRTQGPVLTSLEALGAEYRPYWIANMIWVRAGLDVVQAMAQRGDVARVAANPAVPLDAAVPQAITVSPETVELNIELVNAPDVWAAGVTGQEAVVAGADTGYQWDHPALKDMYRGWDGASADHNYSWHDAIHSGGGSCGPDSPEPCDDYWHGTHTMGIMVGDDGGSNQIGMAPGARWIGCRNMNVGYGTPTTYSECFQWFVAPTDLNDQNPDPAMAPHVINNSWSCPPSEGCSDPNILLTVVQNTRAAGIVFVVSAGNSGPGCSTVNTPAAIYEASFTVGSTTLMDSISGFSSRGPVTVDGSSRLKPNISAPGSGVVSSVPTNGYGVSSGTSMAAPHVAGLVALLVSANPALDGNVNWIEDIIENSAVSLTSMEECGGVPGSQIPNNTFGFGRIDAQGAFLNTIGQNVFLPFVNQK